MSVEQTIDCQGNRRTTYDPLNERVRQVEWKCKKCGEWINEDEMIWATDDGVLDTDKGHPWCDGCVPEENEGDEEEGYVDLE